jgi:hypothetical protein
VFSLWHLRGPLVPKFFNHRHPEGTRPGGENRELLSLSIERNQT